MIFSPVQQWRWHVDKHAAQMCKLQSIMSSGRKRLIHQYTVSKKNVPPLDCYNFETCEWILIFFGRNVTDRVSNQTTLHCESKKGCHPNHGYNFVNSWSICKILSLLQRAVNFQQNPHYVTHHTLSMLLHYLENWKNQKFALLMHIKHVSNVTFYHRSNRQKKCQMSLK